MSGEGDMLDLYVEIISDQNSAETRLTRADFLRVWRERGERAPFPVDLLEYLRRHHPISLLGRLAKWCRELRAE